MPMPTSPLTREAAERLVPNSVYAEDSAGLWFDPKRTELEMDLNIGKPFRASLPQEVAADRTLAAALHTRYVKKVGRFLDVVPDTGSLVEEFKKLGYESFTTRQDFDHDHESLDLITLIHSFQKIPAQSAVQALSELAQLLTPEGYIFIRLPDHSVEGYERDMARGEPCFWNLHSFLELLAQVETLKVVETYEIKPGQRDLFLRKLEQKPRICAGLIVKNEERDLPKLLKSIKGVAEGIVIIDTGSIDKTMEVAEKWIAEQKRLNPDFYGHVEQYLGASEQDDKGDWKLWDFGKARNVFVKKIDELDAFNYCLWMDADDILLNPRQLKNLVYLDAPVIHGIGMNSGDISWVHHRLWKTRRGVRFNGRCHEYPAWAGSDMTHHDIQIYHDAAPGVGESANKRNLRILEREVKESPTPRVAFYLANTHKDGARYAEAVPYYDMRMGFGKGYEEEYWFAALYKARCLRYGGKVGESEKFLFECLKDRSDWAEFWMELCYIEYDRKNWEKCLAYALLSDRPIPPSSLFREPNKYTDQPFRYASFAAEFMGERAYALKLAHRAKEKIGGKDADWEKRIEMLEGPSKPMKITKKRVLWHRPGALGDILMTLNCVAAYRKENPQTHIVYKAHASSVQHLKKAMLEAGIDEVVDQNFSNDGFDAIYNLIGYPRAEGYPEKPMRDHLVRYFARELGIKNEGDVNLFYNLALLSTPNNTYGKKKYVTLHVQSGWSPYKMWAIDRWAEVVRYLNSQGFDVRQIGGPDDPKVEGADTSLLGQDFDRNLHAMAYAKFHMGVDSWSNHATNIIWRPANKKTKGLILWGSTQESAAGYRQNANISLGLKCQPCFREDPKISAEPRGVCPNPPGQVFENPKHACMAGITVDMVIAKVKELILENP